MPDDEIKDDQYYVELSKKFCRDGLAGNTEHFKRARKCRDFVDRPGKQWDDADRASLEAAGVVVLEINHMLPIRDRLVGREVQGRKDIKILPNNNDSPVAAAIQTAIIKHAMNINNGCDKVSAMSKDAITGGKGWMAVAIDKKLDPVKGDISIRHRPPTHVTEDPLGIQYDLNEDCQFVNDWDWAPFDEVEAEFPDKADELAGIRSGETGVAEKTGISKAITIIKSNVNAVISSVFGGKTEENYEEEIPEGQEGLEPSNYRYKVVWSYYTEYKRCVYWIDKQFQTVRRELDEDIIAKDEAATEGNPQRFEIIKGQVKILHYIKRVDEILLIHLEDPFKYLENFAYEFTENGVRLYEVACMLPYVRQCAYFNEGEVKGKMDDILGPQTEENRKRTLIGKLLTKLAVRSWWIKAGIPDVDKVEEQLKAYGSKPGIVVVSEEAPQPLEKQEPFRESMEASMRSVQDMRDIANVPVESMGQKTDPNMSGVLYNLKQQSGDLGNEIIFGHLDHTLRILGDTLRVIINCADVYSEDEIRSIIGKDQMIDRQLAKQVVEQLGPTPQQPPPPNPQAIAFLEAQKPGSEAKISMAYQKKMAEFQQQMQMYDKLVKDKAEDMLLEQIKSVKIGRYSTTVAQSPSTPTAKIAAMMEMEALDRMRPGIISSKRLIEASGLADKEGILEDLMQAQQAQQPQKVA